MSFRARLRLFFVLIVIVPMVSVAIVLFRLIADNETGKTDAAIAAELRTAQEIYRLAAPSTAMVRAVGLDRVLVQSLEAHDLPRANKRARQLLASHGLARIVLVRGRDVLVDAGRRDAIAPTPGYFTGQRFGVLDVFTTTAPAYAQRVRRETGLDVVLRRDGRTIGSTLSARVPELPPPRTAVVLDVGGRRLRAASFDAGGFLGRQVRVSVLTPDTARGHAIRNSFLIAGGILLGFLVLALAFALAVSRSLQAQIASFLQAARRIGAGDFSARAPEEGHDEFAQLGEEFNSMSAQLSARLEELREERARLETSLRRIGETFASNLDRDALLELVVRTAVDGVEAEGGRASTRPEPGAPMEERARFGELAAIGDALRAAEAEALRTGTDAEAGAGEAHALAQPLHGAEADGAGGVIGLVSVGRRDRAFSAGERELFGYLAAQAAISIENVALHESTQRQAITDGLTGLFNHRRFQEAMDSEVERARRFGQDLGLVMLDIDDFKRVNDTYGHQQGDRVLAEVARVLRESSREIDSPARYGGEELAVVLPQTDLDGAYNLAERVRAGIAALELPLDDGQPPLRVTASFGVASLPRSATDPQSLLARADAALYEAKRAGKNKTVRAG